MNVITSYLSPNFTDLEIPIEYVVLHFTAASLERTLAILSDPRTEVSAHLVIARDGTIYELVPCLDGSPRRAWHAGKSRMEVSNKGDTRLVEAFNDRSLGIELVNENGNLFPYSEAQYAALFGLIERLKAVYPTLGHPEAVVGHEQIAGFRGKSDPGLCFEWDRLFAVCYPNQGAPRRQPVCRQLVAQRMKDLVHGLGIHFDVERGEVFLPEGVNPAIFEHLSALSECALSRDEA